MRPSSPRFPSAAAACSRPRAAFTLVELLTVIAIIGILAAIVMATIGQVRQSARRAHCVSNLRQCGTGLELFANDNRGYLPRTTWTLEIRPFVSGHKNNAGAFPVSCPSLPYDDSQYGRSTYSLNAWLDTDHTNNNGGGKYSWDINLRRVESPSRKIMLFDGALAGSGSQWAHNAVKGVEYIDARHQSSTANILFVDGHVVSMKTEAVHEGMWDWKGGGTDPDA